MASSQQTSTENAVDDSDVTNHKKKKAGVDLHQLMNEINASVIGPAQQAAKIRAMQKQAQQVHDIPDEDEGGSGKRQEIFTFRAGGVQNRDKVKCRLSKRSAVF